MSDKIKETVKETSKILALNLGIILPVFFIIFLILTIFILFVLKKNLFSQREYIDEKMQFFSEKITEMKSNSFQQTVSAVDPLQRVIERVRIKIEDLEKRGINEENQLKNLFEMQKDLQKATDAIQKEAFRFITLFTKPNTRGGWAEEQLKTIIESVGMVPYCDFTLQANMGSKRPDVVIKLPNDGLLFIDSKAPLDSYLSAPGNLTEVEFDILRKNNLKAIKNHIYSLSNKKYWSNEISPEMVVMFLPMERIWLDALEEDPKLLDYAASKNVIIATPMTLIALLKIVFFGWNQLYIARDAEKLKSAMTDLTNATSDICDRLNDYIRANNESQSKLIQAMNSMKELNLKVKNICTPIIESQSKNTQVTGDTTLQSEIKTDE